MDSEQRRKLVADMRSEQAEFHRRLRAGAFNPRVEIQARAMFADMVVENYQSLNDRALLSDAAEHYEAILRRVPPVSSDYARYEASLADARLSEFMLTGSKNALDQAIQHGHNAMQLAKQIGLPETGGITEVKILSDLSTALSERSALSSDQADSSDLESAIAYTRQMLEHSSSTADSRIIALNNLTSQLRRRFNQCHNTAVLDEAQDSLRRLLENTSPGTKQHSLAQAQLGMIFTDKFNNSKSETDWIQAVTHFELILQSPADFDELKVRVFKHLAELYDARAEATKNPQDQARLLDYSKKSMDSLPSDHSDHRKYLLVHLQRIAMCAFGGLSLDHLEEALRGIENESALSSPNIRQWSQGLTAFCNVLGLRYNITGELEHLSVFLDKGADALGRSLRQDHPKSRTHFAAADGLSKLQDLLIQVLKPPVDHATVALFKHELGDLFRPTITPGQSYVFAVMEQIADGTAMITMIDALAARIHSPFPGSSVLARQSFYGYREQHKIRPLAPDESGQFIFDLEGLMSQAVGYDEGPAVGLSMEDFTARQARLEARANEAIRALGRHPNLDLCCMCRDHNKVIRSSRGRYEFPSKGLILPHGNYNQLFCRTHCAVCSLLLEAATAGCDLIPALKDVDREVQGTSLETGYLSSGEQVMRVTYGLRHLTDLRVLTPDNTVAALRQGWQVPLRTEEFYKTIDSAQGPINAAAGQQINTARILDWLAECEQFHNHNPNGEEIAIALPITLIDVVNGCLVDGTTQEKYFALSYVWGQVEMHKTMRHNVAARRSEKSLTAVPFPAVIRDAIALVFSLGEKFLWIDAICMVQDDEDQMARYIPQMDRIYGDAFATIVSVHGDDADCGLPGVQEGTREPQKIRRIRVSKHSEGLDYDPNAIGCDTIRLVATPRPLHLALATSKWHTRGWIVQEQLLSRRCLYFTSDAVYFQCQKHTRSEYGIDEEYFAQAPYMSSHLHDTINRQQLFTAVPEAADKHWQLLRAADRVNPLDEIHALHTKNAGERILKAFQIYHELLQLYTKREFTYKSDVLRGFAGIFAVLELHFQGKTYFGLPGPIFHLALLWSPTARQPRRGARLLLTGQETPSKPDRQFPSWSWAGWDGPVEYRLFGHDHDITKPPKLLAKSFQINPESPEEVSAAYYQDPQDETKERLAADPPQVSSEDGNSYNAEDSATFKQPTQSSPQVENIKFLLLPDASRNSTWIISPPFSVESQDPAPSSTILTITAPILPLAAFQIHPEKLYLSAQGRVHVQSAQAVRRIYDSTGRHCGLWWEQAGYGYVGLGLAPEAEEKFDLVGISVQEAAESRRRELSSVTGEIDIFDARVLPSTGSESGLVNVLVVDRDWPDKLGQRCTVALIHLAAWNAAGPREKNVVLA